MQARDVLAHFQSVGTWVNWDRTCDHILHGDPEAEVKGIATSWIATNEAIRGAADAGLNLFISHEGIFYDRLGDESAERLADEKRRLLDGHGMVAMRCHDVWDRMPDCGIPDAWAAFLGFETEPRPLESFYKICLVGDLTVKELAAHVFERVREIGQESVSIFGDPDKRVSRLAVGTGAITRFPVMAELNPDVLLATDDGMSWTQGGHWAADLGVPLLIVHHGVAEYPGMAAMADYLSQQFPDVPAKYIPIDYPWTVVAG
ncbi:MAG: Nif3-like dinuclear metal center hexameric protein [Armatimonadota bacterium]